MLVEMEANWTFRMSAAETRLVVRALSGLLQGDEVRQAATLADDIAKVRLNWGEGLWRQMQANYDRKLQLGRRIVQFDFDRGAPEDGQEWLQITALKFIGSISRDVEQKIIRLNEEDQKALYLLLHEKNRRMNYKWGETYDGVKA